VKIAAIDQGTTSTRVLAMDAAGRLDLVLSRPAMSSRMARRFWPVSGAVLPRPRQTSSVWPTRAKAAWPGMPAMAGRSAR
jgi:glycerol kinase